MTTQQELLQVINDFMVREYDEEITYNTIEELPTVLGIAYTTTGSGEHEVQVDFNFEKLRWEEYIDGDLVFINKRESLDDFIDELRGCTFEGVIEDILWEAERREEEEEKKMKLEDFSLDRLCEIATMAIHGLLEDDFETAIEYFEDTMDLSPEEMEFFGVAMEGDEE